MKIDSVIHSVKGRPHYLISLEIRSVGLLKFFYSDLLLKYESYISADNDSHPFQTIRELKHGKKNSVNHDYFKYNDSLRVMTYSVNKSKERHFAFDNSDNNIRDVLGTYLWYRQKNMFELKNDTSYFFLAGKVNNIVFERDAAYKDSDNIKFKLSFPGVPDMPKKNSHYILVSKKSNTLSKVKVSMDVGNFYFTRNN